MYRILKENQQVKERRNLLRHPEYKKPELLATAPNQVWSWDITKRAPRPLVGAHMCGMHHTKGKGGEAEGNCRALRCCRARAQAAVTCSQLAG